MNPILLFQYQYVCHLAGLSCPREKNSAVDCKVKICFRIVKRGSASPRDNDISAEPVYFRQEHSQK